MEMWRIVFISKHSYDDSKEARNFRHMNSSKFMNRSFIHYTHVGHLEFSNLKHLYQNNEQKTKKE
jgi:hypothetical protein